MKHSEQINELAAALSKAQGEFRSVSKDAENPFFKSSYSTLSSVIEVVRAPLVKYGLSFTQGVDGEQFISMLMHSSGQWLQYSEPFKPAKNDPQSIGSLKSYLSRYGLKAMLGLASDDDDGEAAMDRNPHIDAAVKKVEQRGGWSDKPFNRPFVLSDKQIARLYKIAAVNGWDVGKVMYTIKDKFNCDLKDMSKDQYDEMCDKVLTQKQTKIASGQNLELVDDNML